jgi:serine/threonine protein kinase
VFAPAAPWRADVKAANILLKKNDNARGYTAKLADFGVSRMMTEAQSHITVQGRSDLVGIAQHATHESQQRLLLRTTNQQYAHDYTFSSS